MYQRLTLPLALWLLATLSPANSRAEGPGNIDIQQYQPPPFYYRYLRVDAPEVLSAGKTHFALDVDYAYKPLVLTDVAPSIQSSRKTSYDLIRHAVAADIAASLGVFGRFELGASLPFVAFQTGEATPGTKGPGLLGVGNPRVGIKARILGGHGGPFGLGASVVASLPTGIGGALIRDADAGGEARLFAGYHKERWSLAGTGGYRWRTADHLYDVAIGNEATFGIAGDYHLFSHTHGLLDVAGSTAAGSGFGSTKETPIEALLGLRQQAGQFELTVAAGPGLMSGYGSPVARAVLALAWSDTTHDADGDGIPDELDKCPNEPEDKDGFEDKDGCPDPDNDKDGILDADDKCPNEPEDKDGFEDKDGCPDPDNDKDKIPDFKDKCPDKPENYNGFQDEDGCPDEAPAPSDRDKDGILDDDDECPDEPEDKDGFEDEDGCPDLDNDKDGIPDAKDKCPNEPETINGFEDEDGCPDKGPEAAVKIGSEELETLRPIFFATDRARVRHAFHNTLGQIALTLKAHPELGRCAVEGHTDDTGPEEWNQKLSQLRAQSVVEFLVGKGVERERLTAIGHGESVPWTSNETEQGRAKNRRVIFHIEGASTEDPQKQERRKRVRERRAAAKDHASEPDKSGASRSAADSADADAPAPRPSSTKGAASSKGHERATDSPRQAYPSEKSLEKPTDKTAKEKAGKDQPDSRPGRGATPDDSAAGPTSDGKSTPAPSGRSAVAPPPKAGTTPGSKRKSSEPENPKTLRELLKLPQGGGLDEAPPTSDGARDMPGKRK